MTKKTARKSIYDEYIDNAAAEFAKQIDNEIMEQLGWQLMLEGNPDWKLVQIPYNKRNDDSFLWNEACAWAIEQFGLPGEKYLTHLNSDHIHFLFRNEEDAVVFTLRWV